MEKHEQQTELTELRKKSHMPAHSVFFEKIVPILLILLGVILVGMVLFAVGVLVGIVKF
ncbi:MAG TPA: hypothetical protein VKF38_16640 [Anaerolineaceae bacterium]|nr:hypothetical protein [Anaerolineaceae bacterium]